MIQSIINTASAFLPCALGTGTGVTQAAASGTSTASGTDLASACTGGSLWSMIIIYGAIGLIFYFLIYRPQKKRRKQEEALRSNVEVGDEIITIGGICGRIVSVKEDETIVVEIGADRTKLKMKSWSISSNESAKERQAAAAPAEKKKFSLFGKKNDEQK